MPSGSGNLFEAEISAELKAKAASLKKSSFQLREWIVEMITEAKSGHPGGSLSAIDLVSALWLHEMRGIRPERKSPPGACLEVERDRFILSKGHAVPALYAVGAYLGLIDGASLKTLRRTGSILQGHPDRVRMPWVEASTGSLGQGLSVAQGLALAAKADSKPTRVFCLVGDGEIQEGQIWEAALSAPKFKLNNLCVILDSNNGQIDGPVSQVMPLEPLDEKWRAFGWDVFEIDGHDYSQILGVLEESRRRAQQGSQKPTFIIARTIKGKGVSFMENKIEWHGVAPKPDECKRAIEELRTQVKAT